MDVKKIYDVTAERYDERHDNPRTAEMRKVEERLIKKFSSAPALDIGCGTGQHLKHAGVGVDISAEMLREAKKKCHALLVQSRAEELPFRDNSFSTVLCIFAVLNLCDYGKAVKEIHRVLKKGGVAIVSTTSIWDHSKESLPERVLSGRKSRLLAMRIEKFRFRFFAFSKSDLINLFKGFRLVHFEGLYTLARPYWGWHRDFSLKERIKLKAAFAAERLLQPFNRAARMYFAVFRKLTS